MNNTGASFDPTKAFLPAKGIGQTVALSVEVMLAGLKEIGSHRMRSLLTLTLLMLGVFALVVMTSALDGVRDKTLAAYRSLAWNGTVVIAAKKPATTADRKRFAMSPGLRYEDLARVVAPHPKMGEVVPIATDATSIFINGREEPVYVMGTTPNYFAVHGSQLSAGRIFTEEDQTRRSAVAVVGATLGAKLFNGLDPIGRDVVIEGINFRIVGLYAPKMVVGERAVREAYGFTIPLATYMDRLDPTHSLEQVTIKLKQKKDLQEVSRLLLTRAKQAHRGIEDVKIWDMGKEYVKVNQQLEKLLRGWKVVLYSLAGTVLLVGGVGVLSVMLISFSERRYEIGLRKSLGASDQQIFLQFVLEALVLTSLGAVAGLVAASVVCAYLGDKFPYGLPLNAAGLVLAWTIALILGLIFGLYPAWRAKGLSPMEAMR